MKMYSKEETIQLEGHTIAGKLFKELNQAFYVPIPSKDKKWQIRETNTSAKPQRKRLILFTKKNDISPVRLNELQIAVLQTPGSTRNQIDKLKKRYPNSPSIFMLSAICSYGMLSNSCNQDEMLESLKTATKEAATSMHSYLSVHNCEFFFKIYFSMLEKLKRKQTHVLDALRKDNRAKVSRRKVMNAMALTDQLASEQSRITQIMNRLKKKMTSSHYSASFNLLDIKRAANNIVNRNPSEKSNVGTAMDMITYVYALSIAMARVPLLSPLTGKILALFPDDHQSLMLRKISIRSVRNFSKMKLSAIESDRSVMTTLGKTLLKENLIGMHKMDGQALHHSFETDSFFNLSLVAQMSNGLYNNKVYQKITEMALEAMESVIKRDMSRNNIFTKLAAEHSAKLAGLRDGIFEDRYQEHIVSH